GSTDLCRFRLRTATVGWERVWMIPHTLHEQHEEFIRRADDIRRVADVVGLIPGFELRERVCELYDGVTREVIPHAMAEDRFPFAQVTGRLDGDRAQETPLIREHLAIARLIGELEALRWELARPELTTYQEQSLRRVLYGLYALVRVHLVEDSACSCEPQVVNVPEPGGS
ncbi:MAG TPA: hemerythrin domain-containing protein, partial [Actinomycetota bacterium]